MTPTPSTLTITEIINDRHYWRRRGRKSKPARQTIWRLIKVGILPATKKEGLWVVERSDWRDFKKRQRPVGGSSGKPNVPSLDRYPDDSGDWLTVKAISEDAEYWRSRTGRDRVSKNVVFSAIHRQESPLPATQYRGVYFVRKADWEAFKKA